MTVQGTRIWAEYHIRAFLDHCEALNRSPKTILAYSRDLAEFATHIQESVPAAVPDGEPPARTNALREAAGRYLAALRRRGNQPRSIGRRIACLRSFAKWMLRAGILSADPFLTLETPRAAKRLPKVAFADELPRLLDVPTTIYDRCLMAVFVFTGRRIAEIQRLRVEHIQRGPKLLTVIGKGNKEVSVELNDEALAYIEAQLASLGRMSGPLFPSPSDPDKPLSISAMRKRVYHYTQQALGRRLYPHALRATFATWLHEMGVELGVIQQLMGHASPATTMGYTRISSQARRAAIDRLRLNRGENV